MAPPVPLTWLTWNRVIQCAVFCGIVLNLAFARDLLSVLRRVEETAALVQGDTKEVKKVTKDVARQTTAMEEAAQTTTALLHENQVILDEHTSLTHEHQAMFARLHPLFTMVIERLDRNLAVLERLERQCPPAAPPRP